MTLIAALTGNIASGKSTVARLFEEWGATVIDADQLVRTMQQPGHPIFDRIVAEFGPEILSPSGELDRARLAEIIFTDESRRRALEEIVHPEVRRQRLIFQEEARLRGDRLVLADIPLLFEAEDPTTFDAVILVDAPEQERLRRLVELRQLDPERARRQIEAQMPAHLKRERSDHVIDNDSSLAELTLRARRVFDALVK